MTFSRDILYFNILNFWLFIYLFMGLFDAKSEVPDSSALSGSKPTNYYHIVSYLLLTKSLKPWSAINKNKPRPTIPSCTSQLFTA